MRVFRYVLSGLSFLLAVAWFAIERAIFAVPQLAAKTVLAIDRLIPPEPDDKGRSRFAAFLARAFKHPDYFAGHFDPGRSMA